MDLTDLKEFASSGDALVVVPPFIDNDTPALGAHMVQAAARAEGLRVSVLYASLLLSVEIGESISAAVAQTLSGLMGERFFAAAAYDVPLLGLADANQDHGFRRLAETLGWDLPRSEFARMATNANRWLDDLADAIAELDFPIVGCSTTFQQTAAAIALLKRVKQRRPDTITILGGANCEGEMAHGLLSLHAGINFVFSGESETTLCKFLHAFKGGKLPDSPVIEGEPCNNMDQLPLPDFSEYYEQREVFLHDSLTGKGENIWLMYESSRGCWWGQKHHCTFCGISDQTVTFRAKSAARVVDDVKSLMAKHPTNKLNVVDWIMPQNYFREMLPQLATEVPGLYTYYLMKANLSLDDVVALKKAGCGILQPGIEALSTSLLKRMNKGVSASQNVTLLRYGAAVDLRIAWNFIYGFPGDTLSEYEEMLKLLPLLRHLNPPLGAIPLGIHRFSPYLDRPGDYGITNVRPSDGYLAVLPEYADAHRIAYHFQGDYRSAAKENPKLIDKIKKEIDLWTSAWNEKSAPSLRLTRLFDDQFLLLDTRALPGTQEIHFLNREQAALVLAGATHSNSPYVDWAIENKLAVELDGRIIPLATAEAEIINQFEVEIHSFRRRSLQVLANVA